MKKAIAATLQPYKDRLLKCSRPVAEEEEEQEEVEMDEVEEDNLQLGAFHDDDDEEEEEMVMDYNIEVDETEIATADPAEDNQQRHILDNHEISGFSFNVVTLPHLQHYFKKPFTYSGVDAGKLLLLLLLLSFSLSLPRLGTVPNLNSHQRTNRVYLG